MKRGIVISSDEEAQSSVILFGRRKDKTIVAHWQHVRNVFPPRLEVGQTVRFRCIYVHSKREAGFISVLPPEQERERLLKALEQKFRHDEKIAARAANREKRKKFLAAGTQLDASA